MEEEEVEGGRGCPARMRVTGIRAAVMDAPYSVVSVRYCVIARGDQCRGPVGDVDIHAEGPLTTGGAWRVLGKRLDEDATRLTNCRSLPGGSSRCQWSEGTTREGRDTQDM